MSINKLVSICFLLSYFLGSSQDQSTPTEIWGPIPIKVKANNFVEPPSDATILFDGKDFSNWTKQYSNNNPEWKINQDGSMTVINGKGGIKTKESFGSVQLHIEWKTTDKDVDKFNNQKRSNSGIFFQEKYEVQILDSYNNPTYVNGQAGSVYKQYIPLFNSSKKPGEWQSYDIVFNAPEFRNDKLIKPGYFTVFQNGVLIQNHVEIQGTTTNVGAPMYEAHQKASISLQDHCCLPLSFRNIWVRNIE
ncbi:MAG: 3-keto-disaccharide hydrolase [Flavobacteriales bacterium]|jgi:hypothetical protein|tara:strand:+ start:6813 stop:7556 length:744 start_codon:yes stop_codon:yes gene_type:complete